MLEHKLIEVAEFSLETAYDKFNELTGLDVKFNPSLHGFEGAGYHICRVASPGRGSTVLKYTALAIEREQKKNKSEDNKSTYQFGPIEVFRYLQSQNEVPDCNILYYVNVEDYDESDSEPYEDDDED